MWFRQFLFARDPARPNEMQVAPALVRLALTPDGHLLVQGLGSRPAVGGPGLPAPGWFLMKLKTSDGT